MQPLTCAAMPLSAIWRHPFTSRGLRMSSSALSATPRFPCRRQLTQLAGREFVLAAGTIDARKNGISLLQTWRRLIGEFGDKTPLLLFAGMYGRVGGAELRARLESDAVLAQFVRVVNGPPIKCLAWLYKKKKYCLFSIFPSHVEGWGLPVGESAWFGSLCVASKASSIPEVCGELMDYVDPADTADITRAVRRLITDRDYLQQRKNADRAGHVAFQLTDSGGLGLVSAGCERCLQTSHTDRRRHRVQRRTWPARSAFFAAAGSRDR